MTREEYVHDVFEQLGKLKAVNVRMVGDDGLIHEAWIWLQSQQGSKTIIMSNVRCAAGIWRTRYPKDAQNELWQGAKIVENDLTLEEVNCLACLAAGPAYIEVPM